MTTFDRRNFLKQSAFFNLTAFAGLASVGHAKTNTFDSSSTNEEHKSWSIAILPDIQNYTCKYPGLLDLQMLWLIENKNKHNIVFCLQNGDMTQHNTEEQWQRADRSFKRIDGKIPYAISLGNHDYGQGGRTDTRETLGNKYFPVSRFAESKTFGSVMEPGKIDNMYQSFKVYGQDYLVVSLEFGPRDKVLDWCNNIIPQFPDHKVIVMTHAYLYHDSTRYDWKTKGNRQGGGSPHKYPIAKSSNADVNDGEQMWEKMVKRHPNIFMTVNGHVGGDGLGFLTSKGDSGNKIHQMLVNFQFLDIGGGSWLRILNFTPDGNKINVRDYSPLYEAYNDDIQNKFDITL